jgi:thymidine kinase
MIIRHDEHGNVIKSGNLVDVGAESKYRSVCRKHWKLGIYEAPKDE